ncbi:uncharacterized protein LOC125905702 [Epinephelus fuscoguttatus]|uniref:uncharacterized protein LOC125905702 n=1 Tax=Epinephelus fuscoguttatus TaxID=293821 RepID=UPI0020D19BB0|nr:uncharacterized protein LOC125905702 [Epinephelus fuscoguttatus]XP_049459824.1 uncharacterized protein LOC125905702 [Epinephelus fuscoguttatus]
MAARQRRRSISEPLNFSDSTEKLMRHAASFISAFDVSEPKMRQIVGEFNKIIDEVTEMQQMTDEQRRKGVRMSGILMAVAPLTLGLSLIGAAVAAADVVGANKTKIREEKESVKKVKELGKEFMEIVELLKNDLEEIKTTYEELEQRSAEGQAADTLSDMEEFQRIVGRVSELRRRTGEVLDVTVTVLALMRDLFMFILSVFRVTATPEEDQKLRDSIIKSADQCQKVINAFDWMKVELLVIIEETKSLE